MRGFDEFLQFDSTPWRADAACTGLTHLMFPERGDPTDDAKRVCAGCPVRVECLDFAFSLGSPLPGIWAGLSELERRKLRSDERRTVAS